MKSSPLVVYHGNCPDGFGAALAAYLVFGDAADYVQGTYSPGEGLPQADGRDLFILDYAYPRAEMEQLAAQAASLTLLDHHVTSAKNLSGWTPVCCGKVHLVMDKSGAVLAWEHFHPGVPVPQLLAHIQDRDLWTWRMPKSAAFLAWLDRQPRTFQHWARFLRMTDAEYAQAVREGQILLDAFKTDCEQLARTSAPICLAGVPGRQVSAGRDFVSHVGHLLAEQSGTFGLVWFEENGLACCSLRAVKDSDFDVEQLARQFGGGGHKTASGFKLPMPEFRKLLSPR